MSILDENKWITTFYIDNEKLVEKLIAYLIGATKLELELPYYKYRHVSTCFVNGEAGLSLRVQRYDFLTDDEMQRITNAFPIEIDGYKFELLSIFDYDYDDDRSWMPSICIRIIRPNE